MVNTRPNLILTFVVLVILLELCSGSGSMAAEGCDDSGLQDKFSKIRAGMNRAQVEEILGPADEVIPGETDALHAILVWRERSFWFTRATVLVKFKSDRVAIASHTAGNIRNPASFVEKIEIRSHGASGPSSHLYDHVIPGALLSETKPWADLSSILAKLDEARTSRSPVEPDAATLFDSITPEHGVEAMLERGGTPHTAVTRGASVTHTWELGGTRVTATFEQGTLTGKRLDSGDLKIVVRENYWKAKDRRSGLTVTEYL